MTGTRKLLTMALCAAVAGALAFASPAGAQKKKRDEDRPAASSASSAADTQVLETAIGEMLAAWQIGDVELLKKYYADDVTVVSGVYEPPLVGRDNYIQGYQRQRERMQGVRIDRRNTLIQVRGTTASAIYQWEMRAEVNGQGGAWRGHTTLLFEKRGGNWLIVLNHTSLVETAQPAQTPQPSGNTQP